MTKTNRLFALITTSLLTVSCYVASAGPSVSGGVPPQPRAVVIQGHLEANGNFDLEGRKLALNLIAEHVAGDSVVAMTQREDLQSADRSYLCIEYRSGVEAFDAKTNFEQLLSSHPTLEVVDNGGCK